MPVLMKRILFLLIFALYYSLSMSAKINREALVTRHNPHLEHIDTLGALSVGNGEFAFTCDVTGLQTFHNLYSNGIPLGTMAQWAWHSFPNTKSFVASDALRSFDFGRGGEEWYSCQAKEGRAKEASDYLRSNPHRLHLGAIGFEDMEVSDISSIDQTLDLWNGVIHSRYYCKGKPMEVHTVCHPNRSKLAFSINDPQRHSVSLRLPYPTGRHSDDACDWSREEETRLDVCFDTIVGVLSAVGVNWTIGGNSSTASKVCTIAVSADGAEVKCVNNKYILVTPVKDNWSAEIDYVPTDGVACFDERYTNISALASSCWQSYWQSGGAVDFSMCTDPRAFELERRVVLSQYLLAIQCAGSTPPQETGLTYNSWFGKFHLEMIWWHQAHFALWGHPEMMARTLPWYESAAIMAKQIAERQGFEGIRWMKMTDPSAAEAPSNVGSFLIWQQPHFIYLCELLYRATGNKDLLHRYAPLVQQTAEFMASFATYDADNKRYILKGAIPAQETLKAAETINPPFELSYWHFALGIAQKWRERLGLSPNPQWKHIVDSISHLTAKQDVYAAAETAPSYPALKPFRKGDYDENGILTKTTTATRENKEGPFEASQLPEAIKLYSDHMAVLAACGVLPESPQYDMRIMQNTLLWVMQNWNWDKTWGWDYPTTCMTAVRTGMPEIAIEALLKDCRTNTYLPNGHNYQDSRLRCYLPGNGGLLTAVALMCAGYDGCNTTLPGFPKDGSWDVRYEGLLPMP